MRGSFLTVSVTHLVLYSSSFNMPLVNTACISWRTVKSHVTTASYIFLVSRSVISTVLSFFFEVWCKFDKITTSASSSRVVWYLDRLAHQKVRTECCALCFLWKLKFWTLLDQRYNLALPLTLGQLLNLYGSQFNYLVKENNDNDTYSGIWRMIS